MPTGPREMPSQRTIAEGIAALAATDGCARHPAVVRLTAAQTSRRDAADAVHALCSVHGRTTTVFGLAAQHALPGVDHSWLADVETAFSRERAYLAALMSAVGPLPSTPGQAESDGAFAALRHTFDMLATSDRRGCAIGAAIAVVIDWRTFRRFLDDAAERLAVDRPGDALPDEGVMLRHYAAPQTPAGFARAIHFGAQQAFAQHRGLLDLIEARACARDRL